MPRHSLEVPTNISISSISLKRISYTYPIKIVRLCGEEIDGKKRFNYKIYLKHVPTEEQKMLSEINEKGLGLFHTFPTNERTNYTLCYDIDLIRNKKKTLLNPMLS